jgi:hypothetical protein
MWFPAQIAKSAQPIDNMVLVSLRLDQNQSMLPLGVSANDKGSLRHADAAGAKTKLLNKNFFTRRNQAGDRRRPAVITRAARGGRRPLPAAWPMRVPGGRALVLGFRPPTWPWPFASPGWPLFF